MSGSALEIRLLRYFLAVAEARSFTGAAHALGISQPTLSHQIKKLETYLGTVLFERAARNVTLSSAGTTFKPFCDRVLKELDSGVLAISELTGLMRGTLRMAVFHSFANSGLGPVFAQFARLHPGVRIEARLLPRMEMERDLIAGTLDLAIAYVSEDTEHIDAEKLTQEELVLVVGSQSRLAAGARLQMRRIVDLPLVLLTQEFAARQYLDRFFESRRLQPKVAIEMNAVDPILAVVRNSELATVISEGAVGKADGARIVRLVDPAPRRSLAILWRRGAHRSAAALRMAEMIRSAYGAASARTSRASPSRIAKRGR
ncbi:MAG: LysR family transcriptional regulator [Betaproteobacteria bacterium]|nr:LysR family transcriptional regulator [Betaproteobacteria bacterium]